MSSAIAIGALEVVVVVLGAACGQDADVCHGAIALSAFGDTAGVLKADGSL